MCVSICNLEVGDDETLWFVIDLAKFVGCHDPSNCVTDWCLLLLLTITTCLQTVMGNRKFKKMKLKPLIAATLQSLCITARSNIPLFPPLKPLTEGLDLFGMSQELCLETIDFWTLQQAWLSAPDEELCTTIVHYILPMNAIICSSRGFYSGLNHLQPLILQTNQGTEMPTMHMGLVP